MGLFSSKKSSGCAAGCVFMKWLVALLLFIVTIAALIGVYETHVIVREGATDILLQFGSTSGSFAIIAFTIALMAWVKTMIAIGKGCEVCKKR